MWKLWNLMAPILKETWAMFLSLTTETQTARVKWGIKLRKAGLSGWQRRWPWETPRHRLLRPANLGRRVHIRNGPGVWSRMLGNSIAGPALSKQQSVAGEESNLALGGALAPWRWRMGCWPRINPHYQHVNARVLSAQRPASDPSLDAFCFPHTFSSLSGLYVDY